MINFFIDDIHFKFPVGFRTRCKKWIHESALSLGFKVKNLNIILLSDDKLLSINQEFLNHNDYTDIVTFNYNSNQNIEGELYISFDRILENSKKFNTDFLLELKRVIIHGVIHLSGYEDHTVEERDVMTNIENKFLEHFL